MTFEKSVKRYIKTENDLTHYYKWEFIRRSTSYQNDYDAYLKAKNRSNGKAVSWNCKYGVFAADYRNSYPGCIKSNVVDEAVVFFSQFKPSEVLRIDAWSDQALSETKIDLDNMPYRLEGIKFKKMHGEDIPDLKKMKTLRLAIDINSSKKRLVNSFKTTINFYKSLVKGDKKGANRKRFNEYDRYLKVYDLREQPKPWSWEKLAKRFYGVDIERGDMDYAKKKVKRDYERCKKLIDGDYRQIK